MARKKASRKKTKRKARAKPEDSVVTTSATMACSNQYDLLRSAVLLALRELGKGTKAGSASAERVLRKAVGE